MHVGWGRVIHGGGEISTATPTETRHGIRTLLWWRNNGTIICHSMPDGRRKQNPNSLQKGCQVNLGKRRSGPTIKRNHLAAGPSHLGAYCRSHFVSAVGRTMASFYNIHSLIATRSISFENLQELSRWKERTESVR